MELHTITETDKNKEADRADNIKSVNYMKVRDESYYASKIVNSEEDAPIFNGTYRKGRWKEYFQELYNQNSIKEDIYEAKDLEILEPEILYKEI